MKHARKTGGPRPTTLRIVPSPSPNHEPIRPTDSAHTEDRSQPSRSETGSPPFNGWSEATAAEFADLLSELRAIPVNDEVPAPAEPGVPTAPDAPSIPEPSVPQPDESPTPAVPDEPSQPLDPVPSPEVPSPAPSEVPEI